MNQGTSKYLLGEKGITNMDGEEEEKESGEDEEEKREKNESLKEKLTMTNT